MYRITATLNSLVFDQMYELARELDPGGIASRQFARQNIPSGEYPVAGNNCVMSVDGHHKLSVTARDSCRLKTEF